MIKHINKQEFEDEVLKSNKLVLVDFFATWCGPCKMLSPVLDEIANEIDVYKINIDEQRDLAIENGIEVVPTIFIFKNGKKVKSLEGFRSKSELLEEIEKVKE